MRFLLGEVPLYDVASESGVEGCRGTSPIRKRLPMGQRATKSKISLRKGAGIPPADKLSQHKTDQFDKRIIGPKRIAPVEIKLMTQQTDRSGDDSTDKTTLPGGPGKRTPADKLSARN